MRPLDEELKNVALYPKKILGEDFTSNVLQKIKEQPRHKSLFSVRKLFLSPKPAVAILALVCLFAGGSVYAATGGWPVIQALLRGHHPTSDGRIVEVAANNCDENHFFSISNKYATKGTYYFKVTNGSKLTDDQVVQIVRGYCEISKSGQVRMDMSKELDKNPLNRNRTVGYYQSKVTEISNQMLRLESNVLVDNEVKKIQKTFQQIDPHVIVYERGRRLTMQDIRVGDDVSVVYRISNDQYLEQNPETLDADAQVVVLIEKDSKEAVAAMNYLKYHSNEFEQVVPCLKDQTGYCTAEQIYAQ